MQLRYDDDFLEGAVFVCASGRRRGIAPLQIRRFHHEREKLYAIGDPDERNAAFFRLHLEWFRQWQLEHRLLGLVGSFALFHECLDILAFRKARRGPDEGAELYVNENGRRHGLIALRPERFEADRSLVGFVNHELQHLSDMVDPAFGYSPDIDQPGQTASQRHLILDRYRLLWDITIDGRASVRGRGGGSRCEQHQGAFERAYRFLSAEKRARLFEELWTNPSPAHAQLLALASDPRGLRAAHQQLPGAPCPLCGFATFQWSDRGALVPELISRVQSEFPAWLPGQGACSRCTEVYESALKICENVYATDVKQMPKTG
jgi:hypothetical protein